MERKVKWRITVCLSIIIMLFFVGMKYNYDTAPIPEDDGQISMKDFVFSRYTISTAYTTESVVLDASLRASVTPDKAEIYRAKIKANGKYGKFKKIGSCTDFVNDEHEPNVWEFVYKDSTIKCGTAYAYQYQAYCEAGRAPYQYRQFSSQIIEVITIKPENQYTCKIIKNTAKKLIVKLTGKSKKNGLLESYRAPDIYAFNHAYSVELRYKNDNGNEHHRNLILEKFSYDGKKWHTKGHFSIKRKQSVYLHFEYQRFNIYDNLKSIKVTNYQYVQMLFYPVKYNSTIYAYRVPQIRFNLSSGTAAVGNFVAYKGYDEAFVWDGDIFVREYQGYDD